MKHRAIVSLSTWDMEPRQKVDEPPADTSCHLGAPTAWHTGTGRFLDQYLINTGTSRGTGMLIRDLQLPLRTPASPNSIASTQDDFVLLIKHAPLNNCNHRHSCCCSPPTIPTVNWKVRLIKFAYKCGNFHRLLQHNHLLIRSEKTHYWSKWYTI